MDFGEPFILFVSFDDKNVRFGFTFGDEELDKYTIPIPYTDLTRITVDGDLNVNYIGFTAPCNYYSIFYQPINQSIHN